MKNKFSLLITALLPVVTGFVPILVTPVMAGAPSVVKEVQSESTILVTVPPNGKPVTYVLGDKVWTIQPGQTAVLPAGATRIHLPVGTILTVSIPSAKSMEPTKYPYTVNHPISMDALTPDTIQTNSPFMTPGGGTVPAGNIQLPSGTIAGLIPQIFSPSGTTTNPFTVLQGGVTDTN